MYIKWSIQSLFNAPFNVQTMLHRLIHAPSIQCSIFSLCALNTQFIAQCKLYCIAQFIVHLQCSIFNSIQFQHSIHRSIHRSIHAPSIQYADSNSSLNVQTILYRSIQHSIHRSIQFQSSIHRSIQTYFTAQFMHLQFIAQFNLQLHRLVFIMHLQFNFNLQFKYIVSLNSCISNSQTQCNIQICCIAPIHFQFMRIQFNIQCTIQSSMLNSCTAQFNIQLHLQHSIASSIQLHLQSPIHAPSIQHLLCISQCVCSIQYSVFTSNSVSVFQCLFNFNCMMHLATTSCNWMHLQFTLHLLILFVAHYVFYAHVLISLQKTSVPQEMLQLEKKEPQTLARPRAKT